MTDLRQLSDEELKAALAREVEQDPWVPDWDLTHPGRLIRAEQERRRRAAET